MKQLTDIELTKGDGYKYFLKATIFDDTKSEDKASDVIAVRGDKLQMILDWAEWKITNALCEFDDQEDNSMEDYEVVG
jgi:hypothetical protein